MIQTLKLAYDYSDKLNVAYKKTIFNDKYIYYNNSVYWEYDINLKGDSWNNLDFVSIDKNDNVIGYLGAGINRDADKVSCLRIMNFSDKGNYIFSKDLFWFLANLFLKFNYRKIDFSVVVGNPIEKMYDKFCLKYGGRVVGIKIKDIRLHDGEYYDEKFYEIFKEDFIKRFSEDIADRQCKRDIKRLWEKCDRDLEKVGKVLKEQKEIDLNENK